MGGVMDESGVYRFGVVTWWVRVGDDTKFVELSVILFLACC